MQVDYLVTGSGNGQKVVDMVTEGSSLTKNYYDQFKRMMSTPGQGYPYIVQKLNAETASMLADPAVKKALETATGGEVRASTPEEMRVLIRSEIAKWSKVIDEAKIARIE